MIDEVKILLGGAAQAFTDEQIELCINQSLLEVESYCNRKIDIELEVIVERIAIIKLNRLNSEGLASQTFAGVSESYSDGYPSDIMAVLNRKRKIKVV